MTVGTTDPITLDVSFDSCLVVSTFEGLHPVRSWLCHQPAVVRPRSSNCMYDLSASQKPRYYFMIVSS